MLRQKLLSGRAIFCRLYMTKTQKKSFLLNQEKYSPLSASCTDTYLNAWCNPGRQFAPHEIVVPVCCFGLHAWARVLATSHTLKLLPFVNFELVRLHSIRIDKKRNCSCHVYGLKTKLNAESSWTSIEPEVILRLIPTYWRTISLGTVHGTDWSFTRFCKKV